MKDQAEKGIASLGSWAGYTGKNIAPIEGGNDQNNEVTFSLVKTNSKKGVLLIIEDKPIAIISKGVPKINDDFSKIKNPKHQVKLCKGVNVNELSFWSQFITWINLNINSEILKEKTWEIRVVNKKEVQEQRNALIQDRVDAGRKNDYGGI